MLSGLVCTVHATSGSRASPRREEAFAFHMILFVQVIDRVLMTHSKFGLLIMSGRDPCRWKQFALVILSELALGAPRTLV